MLNNSLQTDLDQVSSNVQNVYRVGEVAKNVDKGFGHLSAHVEISVFIL
jgi:hypothetical protein